MALGAFAFFFSASSHADTAKLKIRTNMFAPLPTVEQDSSHQLTPSKIALGKKLFLENALSKHQNVSCNSCHDLTRYGVDGTAVSLGHLGRRSRRNSPTVFNASLQTAQFWDGRARDVEEQALAPIIEPLEMAMLSETEVIDRLRSINEYGELFRNAFPGEEDPITYRNIGRAIGAFERTLLTPSRFDEFLKGKEDALTDQEKEGLSQFINSGCSSCHRGVGVGGNMFQKLGAVKPYVTEDLGRYEVTKNETDKQVFKVPSLRNVEKTAPYFHDGSVPTLNEAVTLMGRHQLGREFSPEQVESIVTFLKSLTGEIPKGISSE